MGGMANQSLNLPNPVTLFSAESEYNEVCLACMAMVHLWMLLNDLKNIVACENEGYNNAIPIMIDNRSAINISHLWKDTKHT